MKKRIVKRSNAWRIVIPLVIGAAAYAAMCLLAAYLILKGVLPEQSKTAAGIGSAAAAALVTGLAVRGGGKQGLAAGIGLMTAYLAFRACTVSETAFTKTAFITAWICLGVPWISSCIFHKKTNEYTKRNRANARIR